MIWSSKIKKYFKDFVGISFVGLHEMSLVYLGEPMGLKALLHTLNVIVISTKMG